MGEYNFYIDLLLNVFLSINLHFKVYSQQRHESKWIQVGSIWLQVALLKMFFFLLSVLKKGFGNNVQHAEIKFED